MKPERWKRAKEILPEARALPLEARAAFLDEACGDDQGLRREIESFLATDPGALVFLERPPIKLLGEGDTVIQEDSRVGAYRILQQLGSGGMGVVYLATRVGDEFKREVAIKVLQSARTSAEAEQRFLQEMGILAKLNHPNIAKLHEGGRTDDGRLYYLMEYVEGRPIDVYCRERTLSLGERLNLYCKVCTAVQYAHRNLVVHRDVKPSNILVTEEGEPKLLDFGVAKPLEGAGLGAAVVTDGDQRLFTADYASPEQITGDTITTASDVYSLGVLLYELLAGEHPYHLRTRLDKEIRRVVCEEMPVPPSVVLSRARDEVATEAAPATDTTTASFRRRLQGDLDTIVLMALRKEPERRYASVEQLSEDIERHLQGLPVRAQPDRWFYRSRKFLRRHWLGIAGVSAFVLLAVGFGIAMFLQQQETAEERDRAEAVSVFLTSIFEASDPEVGNNGNLPVKVVLEEATRQLLSGHDRGTELMLGLKLLASKIHRNLGLNETASSLLRDTLPIAERELGAKHPVTIEAVRVLGLLKTDSGDFAEAKRQFQRALTLYEAANDEPDQFLGQIYSELGWACAESDELVVAKLHLQAARDILLRFADEYPLVYADALSNLAVVEYQIGNYTVADHLLAEVAQLESAEIPHEHIRTARRLHNMALFNQRAGNLEKAEALQQEASAMFRRLLGDNHPSLGRNLNVLGIIQRKRGNYEAAEATLREAVAIQETSLGATHPSLANTLSSLGILLRKIGKTTEAVTTLERSIGIVEASLGKDHPSLAAIVSNLASVYLTEGDFLEALPSFEKARALLVVSKGPDHPDVARLENNLGVTQYRLGNIAAALTHLEEALRIDTLVLGPDHHEIATTLVNLSSLYRKQKNYSQAEAALLRGLEIERVSLGETHPEYAETENNLANLYLELGRFEEAEALYRSSLEVLEANLPPEHPKLHTARKGLSLSLEKKLPANE